MVLGIATVLVPATTYAIDVTDAACQQNPDAAICQPSDDIGTIIQTVINILLFLVGAIAVVMIIVGGVRYTTSAGNADAVKGAKNTIIYAVVGLIIAFLAFAIVNWVVGIF